MGELTLRRAEPADAAGLAPLGTESFVFKFGEMYSPADLASFLAEYRSEAAYAATLADPAWATQIAERDGALLGYCTIGSVCGWPDHARGRRAFELRQLYLASDATGGGIGGALMDWALAEARAQGADEVQLSVFSGNDGAQRFYVRHGFEKVADTTFKVGEQVDHEYLFARMV
ncbi:MAG: GNAT family N-acetyltransferase [Novosphingobium sp.]